jgi:adenylate cyclase
MLFIVIVPVLFLIETFLFANYNRYFPFSVPLLAMLLTYNTIVAYLQRHVHSILGRFIGPEMTDEVIDPTHKLGLGGRVEVATAFFCDLRDFSKASANLPPEQLASQLSEYTAPVTSIVQEFGGRPIDYFGDGVFAIFPPASRRSKKRHRSHHALRAVRAAIAVQERVSSLLENEAHKPLSAEIGIGLATGPMLIGVVGSESYMKLGAVGDTVNVASRIQALSRECRFGVLCTAETYEMVKADINMMHCGFHEIRGKEQKIALYGICPLKPTNTEKPTNTDTSSHLEEGSGKLHIEETIPLHTLL